MKINNFHIGRNEISIAVMILSALIAMFFLGYKMAYNSAIDYANEQIQEIEKDLFYQQQFVNPATSMSLLNTTLVMSGGS